MCLTRACIQPIVNTRRTRWSTSTEHRKAARYIAHMLPADLRCCGPSHVQSQKCSFVAPLICPQSSSTSRARGLDLQQHLGIEASGHRLQDRTRAKHAHRQDGQHRFLRLDLRGTRKAHSSPNIQRSRPCRWSRSQVLFAVRFPRCCGPRYAGTATLPQTLCEAHQHP